MTWVRLDEAMPGHPKIAPLSDGAFRLLIYSLCYANQYLTDGHVPTRIAETLVPRGKARLAELLDAGLLEPNGSGYLIHDYHEYQPSKMDVVELRDKRSRAGRIGGKASGKARTKDEAK